MKASQKDHIMEFGLEQPISAEIEAALLKEFPEIRSHDHRHSRWLVVSPVRAWYWLQLKAAVHSAFTASHP
jgi:hypothetical protein